MQNITNKTMTIENIIEIATLLDAQANEYKELALDEKKRIEAARAVGDYLPTSTASVDIKYSITYNNHEQVSKTDDYKWFVSKIKETPLTIENISITYHLYHLDYSQRIYLDLTPKSIDFDFSSQNSQNELGTKIYDYINNLPARYDDTIKHRRRRTFIPALNISIILGLLISASLFLLNNYNVIPQSIAKYLCSNYGLTAIFLVVAFLGALLIPTKNSSLYQNINFETYFAGFNKSTSKSIYKDDIADYKSKCEVAIGNNSNMPNIRKQINVNYKKSRNISGILVIVSIIAIIALFML